MAEPPLSRQPACRYCDPHEDHVYSGCLLELDGGGLCPCPPHRPLGVYT